MSSQRTDRSPINEYGAIAACDEKALEWGLAIANAMSDTNIARGIVTAHPITILFRMLCLDGG
eukprot:1385784-Amorphochlora_amoeboformis.AAC.1